MEEAIMYYVKEKDYVNYKQNKIQAYIYITTLI